MRTRTVTSRTGSPADPGDGPAPTCARCAVPLDARPFDDSAFAAAPAPGDHVVLARFTLPPEYCGVLDHFTQYTDALARSPLQLVTPSIEWVLRVDGRPVDPYLNLRHIVNPWGGFALPLSLRLDEAACVELVARGVSGPVPVDGDPELAQASTEKPVRPAFVGGRIVGRCWYDTSYGGAGRR
jgi:hypothetical protein